MIDPHASSYVSTSPIEYANDNPISFIDPDGRDIILLSAPHRLGGVGHAAVLIGNDKKGWKLYSKNGTKTFPGAYGKSNLNVQLGVPFKNYKEFLDKRDANDAMKYEEGYRIATDDKQDAKMEAAAEEAVESDYEVVGQSCIDVLSDALSAIGLNPGTSYNVMGMFPRNGLAQEPNERFHLIMQNNPGGVLIILPAAKKEKKAVITVGPIEKVKPKKDDK